MTTSSPDRATRLAFAGAVLFGGVNAIAVRVTVLEVPPLWSSAVRFLAAGLILITLLFPFVGVTVATLLVGEAFSWTLVLGGAVALVGVYVGAFHARPNRSAATSAPECLPVDAEAPA